MGGLHTLTYTNKSHRSTVCELLERFLTGITDFILFSRRICFRAVVVYSCISFSDSCIGFLTCAAFIYLYNPKWNWWKFSLCYLKQWKTIFQQDKGSIFMNPAWRNVTRSQVCPIKCIRSVPNALLVSAWPDSPRIPVAHLDVLHCLQSRNKIVASYCNINSLLYSNDFGNDPQMNTNF